MRLWHQKLIPLLPRQQLLGQHRECCALRGNGWGKKHATVNYVFEHPFSYLVSYHYLVMQEMKKRGYNVAPEWFKTDYRGKSCESYDFYVGLNEYCTALAKLKTTVYPEHDNKYLTECIVNLSGKGINLEIGE